MFSESIDEMEPKNEDDYDFSNQIGLDSLREYALMAYKPSDKIIAENTTFFQL